MFLGDNSRVKLDIGRGTHTLCKLCEVGRTAHLLQLALRLELIGYGKKVDWLLRQRQLVHHTIDKAMFLLVERGFGEVLLHLGNLVRLEQ